MSRFEEYKSPFRREKSEYVRQIDIIDGYFEQLKYYIMMVSGLSFNEVSEWVEVAFGPGGEFEHQYPVGEFLVQDPKTQDRVRKLIPLDKVIKKCQEKNIIVAPSMVFYAPESHKKSKLASFFENNVRLRNIIKQEMFAAEAAGNSVLQINKKNEQNSKKTLNNAGSGGFSSPFTILFNMSSHSALTSTCRTATSYGNAANERMLGGRRHYWAPGIIINHILSISTLTNFDKFKEMMDKYGLYYPTAEDVMGVINHSAKDYIKNDSAMRRVAKVVSKMSSLERAAFTYMGDLFHVAKYNDKFLRDFIEKFITPVEYNNDLTDEEISIIEKGIDGDMKIIVSQLRLDLIGVGGNFSKAKKENPEAYRELVANCGHLQKTIGDYSLFISEVLTTDNVPPTIARMPEVLRAVGVVSDTDSTMGSAQWWSKWYCDSYTGETASKVADTMVYIVVQNISHLMAAMSKQLGVSDEKLFTYAMKNEYKFDAFGLTTKAKHYFAQITSQEGTMKKTPGLELKGVSLRTSNIPNEIMDEYKATVAQLLDDIAKGNDVKILPVVRRVAEIEKSIENSIKNSEGLYLKTLDIKNLDSYKGESNYHYHRMYNETFGLKYGRVPEPPYHAVRIPVNLETKTEIKEWLERIEDRGLADKLKQWFDREDRKYKQIIIPDSIVNENGIPKELLDVIDARRTVFAMVEPYYHILEVFNIFLMDGNRTRLLSDYYDPKSEILIDPTDPQKHIDLSDVSMADD